MGEVLKRSHREMVRVSGSGVEVGFEPVGQPRGAMRTIFLKRRRWAGAVSARHVVESAARVGVGVLLPRLGTRGTQVTIWLRTSNGRMGWRGSMMVVI